MVFGQRRNREGGAFFHGTLREANPRGDCRNDVPERTAKRCGRRGLFEHATIYRKRNGVGGLHDRGVSNAQFRGAEEGGGKRREEPEAAGPNT
jgi:hypothetical protein